MDILGRMGKIVGGFTNIASETVELGWDVIRSPFTEDEYDGVAATCLLYTSPSPRDGLLSRMPSSA